MLRGRRHQLSFVAQSSVQTRFMIVTPRRGRRGRRPRRGAHRHMGSPHRCRKRTTRRRTMSRQGSSWRLPKWRERRVLELRFGLEDGRSRTLEEVWTPSTPACAPRRWRMIQRAAPMAKWRGSARPAWRASACRRGRRPRLARRGTCAKWRTSSPRPRATRGLARATECSLPGRRRWAPAREPASLGAQEKKPTSSRVW